MGGFILMGAIIKNRLLSGEKAGVLLNNSHLVCVASCMARLLWRQYIAVCSVERKMWDTLSFPDDEGAINPADNNIVRPEPFGLTQDRPVEGRIPRNYSGSTSSPRTESDTFNRRVNKSRKIPRLLAYLDTDGNDRWSIMVFETL
jgi:hypothetical protein